MKDYIAELVNPDIHLVEEGKILHYKQEDLRALSKRLASLRQEFLTRLTGQMNAQVLNAYLSELKVIEETIKFRRLDVPASIGNRHISLLCTEEDNDDVRREKQTMLSNQILDRYILKSTRDTIAFLKGLLSEEPVMQQAKNAEIVKEATDNVKMEQIETGVISGTSGLAKFLGCSNSMAFAIIDREILKKEGIQYPTGKTWKFNRQKLQEYMEKHPDAFAHIRCKH